ncbi:monocarboxylate transporter 10 isoform X1 [Drosophila bipectinata]|uniref:monocarboxylate transporter 10 isoform X1 n=1 Tax=Drosophila bipectinata TaxID=42026 RepID=UPI001C8AAA58|nr:monocarboxylate transporter 10 isoform X1 [Drosophila bipectinata]XP_017103179.2 monocarboxylate transporter 10 isoform X1 [Drosophila bipectinata]
MAENEPLNETQKHANGRILPANGHISPATNGQVHANGKVATPVQNGNGTHIEAPCCRDIHGKEPPDGGARAWLVMVSAFLCNGIIFGFINTYGVLHSLLTDRLTELGDPEASSKAALIGSLAIGTTFLFSTVAGCLTDKIGLRLTTFAGGVLSAGGLLLSSFFTENISALYFTYGIMFGLGAALAYTPTLAILGHYFKRYLGKVSGFVTAGSSVFTVILPPCLDKLLAGYGLEATLRMMSLVSAFIIICSFVYKPLHPPPEPPKKKPGRSRINLFLRSIVNVEIWKRKRFVIWALCVPLALFGYFVPYVHMMQFVKTTFPGEDVNLPVMCIGITSGIGRLIFGIIADMPGVNRMYLQQLSLVSIGVVTLLLPLTNSYVVLVSFTLVMGLFDGCFISLLGPIAYEICGPSGATQAIGFLLGLSSIPLTVGPPVAGMIFDSTGSYTVPLILAGLPPLVGSSLLFLIKCVKEEENGVSAPRAVVLANGDIEIARNGHHQSGGTKSSAPLMGATSNGVNGTTAEATRGIHSNGHVDNGTGSYPDSPWPSLTRFSDSAACDHPSSSFHTNPGTGTPLPSCSHTALLSRASGSRSSLSQPLNDDLKRRRYTYTVY